MHLWISVYLPWLALEAFRPCWSESGAYVVIERDTVLVSSYAAAQAGVRIGMRRGGVAALAPEATLLERHLPQEQAALDSVALCMLQFTPEVAMGEDDTILLDVTASLSAFGGRLALCRRVVASVAALGFTARVGAAPTARGAWLLARDCQPYSADSPYPRVGSWPSRTRRVLKMTSLRRRLDTLRCALLPAARAHHDWLQGIGCKTLGDLRKLPRAGLQRRTNQDMLQQLDQAYGLAPQLFAWHQAPASFLAKLELPDRTDHAEALLFSAKRLVLQMIGWLVSRHQAVAHFVLSLEHERGRCAIAPTVIEIILGEPAWHEDHVIRLLRERINRTELAAPVIAVRLQVHRTASMLPPTASLFPEPGGTPADFKRLLELLRARLGEDSVLCPAPVPDHRPEIYNAWVAANHAKPRAKPRRKVDERVEDGLRCPGFLLAEPIPLPVREHRPFYGSPLRLVQGPERIEAGWFDGNLVTRDYFIAQGREAICYWIYQERARENNGWFLHGLFA